MNEPLFEPIVEGTSEPVFAGKVPVVVLGRNFTGSDKERKSVTKVIQKYIRKQNK